MSSGGFGIGARGPQVIDSNKGEATTQLLLGEILEQLKLQNLYLSRLAGEELDEQDIGIE